MNAWVNIIDARGRDVLDRRGGVSFDVYVDGNKLTPTMFLGDTRPPSYAPPYIWIANSKEDTISKFSTRSGEELARYPTPPDPSRTAVDLRGDVFVASRGDGAVTKILSEGCEGAACVVFSVQSCPGARGLAVARDGTVWVGGAGSEGCLQQLDPSTGAVLLSREMPAAVYGLALDQRGHIWAVSAEAGQLFELGRDGRLLGTYQPPEPRSLYGIAIDGSGRVWLGNNTGLGVWRYDPWRSEWRRFVSEDGRAYSRGVAVDVAGNVWVANSSRSTVSRFRADSGEWVADYPTGGAEPVGVAIDGEQQVWVVDKGSNTATRLDPESGRVTGTFSTGAGPYTYSDMTGYALFNFVAFEGAYHLFWADPVPGGGRGR
jgi:streptogramin lyase